MNLWHERVKVEYVLCSLYAGRDHSEISLDEPTPAARVPLWHHKCPISPSSQIGFEDKHDFENLREEFPPACCEVAGNAPGDIHSIA